MGAVRKIGKKVKRGFKKVATKVANGVTLGVFGERGVKNIGGTIWGKATGSSTPKSRAKAAAKRAAQTAATKAKTAAKKKATDDNNNLLGDKRKAYSRNKSQSSGIAALLANTKSFDNLPSATQKTLERGIVGRAKIPDNGSLQSLLRSGVSNPFAVERDSAKEATIVPKQSPTANTIRKPNVNQLNGSTGRRGGKFSRLLGKASKRRSTKRLGKLGRAALSSYRV